MNEEIRVLVVDDEHHARLGMRSLLEREKDVDIVGECANGWEAIASIKRLRPDLVFLDVTMPDRNGLGVIDDIGAEDAPRVIFVTAYDEYAVPAFESNAVDYVLKPFTDERFRGAMQRAREQLRLEQQARSVSGEEDRLGQTECHEGGLERFSLKDGDKLRVFSVNQIKWIEADEYYVKLHIGAESYMVRETLGALERQLPERGFVRIHRSTIVNVEEIDSLEPLFQGDATVVLKDGTRLRMSRRRRKALSELIKTFT